MSPKIKCRWIRSDCQQIKYGETCFVWIEDQPYRQSIRVARPWVMLSSSFDDNSGFYADWGDFEVME